MYYIEANNKRANEISGRAALFYISNKSGKQPPVSVSQQQFVEIHFRFNF